MTKQTQVKITSIPSRYEPLVSTFGEKAKMTFVPVEEDLAIVKRLLARAESANQGKMLFIKADSGTGKSTFVHSIEVFLPDKVSAVVRLPPPHELAVADIPAYLSQLAVNKKYTIVNFDGREAPQFNEAEYRTFLGNINSLLRVRKDLIIIWPVTDTHFADRIIQLLKVVGGQSAFGNKEIHSLAGAPKEKYSFVLEKILQIANWRLEDAAISSTEVDELISSSNSIGHFLDLLQSLIAERFEIDSMGVEYPTLVIAISSGDPKIRETCRSLRRADSFYLEASRLLMYTRRSNVAEWWANRANNLRSALPHVIALLNAQLVSLSASAVVHSVLQFGDEEIKQLISGVRADSGNAQRIIKYSELYKYVTGQPVDNREYGSNVKDDTYESFKRLQAVSKIKHLAINRTIIEMLYKAGAEMPDLDFENELTKGLLSDVTYTTDYGLVALEFHHKNAEDSNSNKIAIYVLEKLQEYAINYGLAER